MRDESGRFALSVKFRVDWTPKIPPGVKFSISSFGSVATFVATFAGNRSFSTASGHELRCGLGGFRCVDSESEVVFCRTDQFWPLLANFPQKAWLRRNTFSSLTFAGLKMEKI